MIISGNNSAYENQLKIERLLCKIEQLEQQLRLARSKHRHTKILDSADTTKALLSADELSMLATLF